MAENTASLTEKEIAVVCDALLNGAGIGDICNIDDKTIESLYALAYNLYGAGNYADAETLFKALCLYKHKEKRFWMGLGGCRQAAGEYCGAIDAYAMAGTVALLNDPEPFLYAARCYVKLGDKENAIGAIKGLLTLGDEGNPAHAQCHEKARALLSMLEAQ